MVETRTDGADAPAAGEIAASAGAEPEPASTPTEALAESTEIAALAPDITDAEGDDFHVALPSLESLARGSEVAVVEIASSPSRPPVVLTRLTPRKFTQRRAAGETLFADTSLENTSIASLVLKFCDFTGIQWTNVDARGIQLNSSKLCRAKLNFVNLSGANLFSCNAQHLEATNCNFSGMNAYTARFVGAKLAGCSFRAAQLLHVDFRDADLRQADLRGANLRHADLRGAKLDGAMLAQAILDQAKIDTNALAKALR